MSGRTIKAAVIGHPAGHSLSPVIHNYWFKHHGIRGQYEARDIAPDRLASSLSELIAQGYRGFNITLPHKIAAMACCDILDDAVRAIGAVNTIRVSDDGNVHGSNTDAFGFIENICQRHPFFDFSAGPVLVLGAGGAARGIIHGLLAAGVTHIRVVNRTDSRAKKLEREFENVTAMPWTSRSDAADGVIMLVNATSAGMEGQPELGMTLDALPIAALVYDIVYRPLYTPLLRAAAARGNPVVDGLGMLLHQARPAFKLWTGIMPDASDDLRRALAERLKQP